MDTPLDTSVLDELAETTGADFVKELVDTFLSDAPGMIEDLRSAAASQDADTFRRAAHSLKSNANIFGAHELAKHARMLEMSDLSQTHTQDADWSNSLQAEYDRASAALKAYVNA